MDRPPTTYVVRVHCLAPNILFRPLPLIQCKFVRLDALGTRPITAQLLPLLGVASAAAGPCTPPLAERLRYPAA